MTMFYATINTPGYLPMDDEPHEFETAKEAWEHLLDELERADGGWVLADEDDPEGPQDRSETALAIESKIAGIALSQSENLEPREGTVYGPTPGYDGNHDLGLAYSVEFYESEEV